MARKAKEAPEMSVFLDSRRAKAQSVVDRCLDLLDDPDKLDEASAQQVASILKTVADKFSEGAKRPEERVTVLVDV